MNIKACVILIFFISLGLKSEIVVDPGEMVAIKLSTCPDIKKEKVFLYTFNNTEYAKENNDILVYVFNFDELDEGDLRPVAKRFGLMLPSLISHPREIWGIETPPAVPATFFINPDGELVKSLFRPQTKDSLNSILASIK